MPLESVGTGIYRDVCPTAVLRAIAADSHAPLPVEFQDDASLADSLRHASAEEKAFGSKVAHGALLLKRWCTELQSWAWDGKFQLGFTTVSSPYKHRLEAIRQELASLDMEQQKALVLHAHLQPGETTAVAGEPEYPHLNGLTALVTATIFTSLPYHARLLSLMDTWAARFLVLRTGPDFETQLELAKIESAAAWELLDRSRDEDLEALELGALFEHTRRDLDNRLVRLGSALDTMLDVLEGHGDTLPSQWIDAVEDLEGQRTEWIVATEASQALKRWHVPGDTSPEDVNGHGTTVFAASDADLDPLDQIGIALSDDVGLPFVNRDESVLASNKADHDGEPAVEDQHVGEEHMASTSDPLPASSGPVISTKSSHARQTSWSDNSFSSRGTLGQSPIEASISDHRKFSQGKIVDDASLISSYHSSLVKRVDIGRSTIGEQHLHGGHLGDARPTEGQPCTPPGKAIVRNADRTGSSTSEEASRDRPSTGSPGGSACTPDGELDRRIGNILNCLPTPIAFAKKGGGPPRSHSAKRPVHARSPQASGSPAPVFSLPRASTSDDTKQGSTEIRLYLLMETGKQSPTRLYVRLVGKDGERVMVRVGGGWADLEHYLREYASHHSRAILPDVDGPLQTFERDYSPETSRAVSASALKGDGLQKPSTGRRESSTRTSTPPVNAPILPASRAATDTSPSTRPASRVESRLAMVRNGRMQPIEVRKNGHGASAGKRSASVPFATAATGKRSASLPFATAAPRLAVVEASEQSFGSASRHVDVVHVGEDDDEDGGDDGAGSSGISEEKRKWLHAMVEKAKSHNKARRDRSAGAGHAKRVFRAADGTMKTIA